MRHLFLALLFALGIAGIAVGFTAPVYAQGVALVDAGVDAGAASSTATSSPTTYAIDPLVNPTGYLTQLEAARKAGWPLAILVGVFGLVEVLAAVGKKAADKNATGKIAKLAWLGRGRMSVVIGAAVAISAAAIHSLATGATWIAVASAAIGSVLFYLAPAGIDPDKA